MLKPQRLDSMFNKWTALVAQAAVEEKSVQTSFYVDLDMERLIQEELEWRCRLWQEGVKLSLSLHADCKWVEDVCKRVIQSSMSPRRAGCPKHALS